MYVSLHLLLVWKQRRRTIVVLKSKSSISPPDIIKGRKLRRYLGFELGLNNFISDNANFDLNQGRSWVFKYNFLEKGYNLGSEKFRFITGLGIQQNVFRFDNDVEPTLGDFTDVAPIFGGFNDISKNNLRVSYLTLPLMVDFNSNPATNKFHIAVGGELALELEHVTGCAMNLTVILMLKRSSGIITT